ncbi:LysE family translocator [Streptomyces phaeochromogenes]
MLSTLLAFLGACTLIAASPGPSTVLIIRQSLQSRRSGFLTVLGNETGVFVWGVVAAFGLTALLAVSEMAYDVMRVVGAVALVVFGVRTLRLARSAKCAPHPPAGLTALWAVYEIGCYSVSDWLGEPGCCSGAWASRLRALVLNGRSRQSA